MQMLTLFFTWLINLEIVSLLNVNDEYILLILILEFQTKTLNLYLIIKYDVIIFIL